MSKTNVVDYRLICVSDSRGLQRYTARLANALAATDRMRLSVAGQAALMQLLGDNIEMMELPKGRRSPRTLLSVARALFGKKSTIIHYQGINLITLILLYIASRLGWRTVLTPHNVATHFPNRIYNAIKWRLWRGFDMVVLHTEAELELVPANLRERVAIIPHGEYAPTKQGNPASADIVEAVKTLGDYVIAPGYVRDDKNIDYLIANASLFKKIGMTLVVAGRNQSSFSSEQIATAGRYFDGFLTDADLEHLIANAAAVVLPYDKVSESGVLHQALSVGTPVIASDIPGFRERIREGDNGLFLEELSSASLEAALGKLAMIGFDCAKIRQEHLVAFSWDAIAEQLVEKLDERSLSHQ
ncbi:hypothetical protein GCM10007094_10780 [Pseudovibrio japonicus]|uniref:Glycosyltransferase subfamily 4-like N-terminal domain-containing protein n=1 Tax=Pseudovibrio japonicus TaxID=366534 RepID=A0ABQ3E3K2_9HYPH|nr:glycosyltransferase family 4 protein [Pseudovibrio japonicus]GHB24574.1 hypothetical protein GCM10007094_10780 [Pseudovibrio japonicus]